MYKVMVDVKSLPAAEYLKKEIERLIPLVEGCVSVYEEPPITTLNKIIEGERGFPARTLEHCVVSYLVEHDIDVEKYSWSSTSLFTGRAPSDADYVLEINNQFLFIIDNPEGDSWAFLNIPIEWEGKLSHGETEDIMR
ncbi:hypothetical protein D3C74_49690 [compost metagenome]